MTHNNKGFYVCLSTTGPIYAWLIANWPSLSEGGLRLLKSSIRPVELVDLAGSQQSNK